MIPNNTTTPIASFLQQESAGGILLFVAAVFAMVLANSPLHPLYQLLIDTPVAVRVGGLEIAKPLLLWVNDGLMAIFFLLVGLELKRELLEGELASARQVALPALGAVGGMAAPAACYILLNAGDATAMQGWAIPTATDIAFALGLLSLLGSRVPAGVKIFLTSLAIFDDLGAIVIIALFYTHKIAYGALVVVALCCAALFVLNRRRVARRGYYLLVGAVMWVATLKSGVHATLAGVVLAMAIPMNAEEAPGGSPVRSLEHDLHGLVAFFILPFFAFCNAGINLHGVTVGQLLHGVPLGVAVGLFVGKQVGVFGLCWLGIRMGVAELPKGCSWSALYGTAVLCGIGFTMSLFIASLAFEESGVNLIFDERIGIIVGSLAAGLLGYAILRKSLPAEG